MQHFPHMPEAVTFYELFFDVQGWLGWIIAQFPRKILRLRLPYAQGYDFMKMKNRQHFPYMPKAITFYELFFDVQG